MKQYYYDDKGIDKQQCEMCGRFLSFKDMRVQHTVDGDLLVCNNCFNTLKKEIKENKEREKNKR